MSSVTSSSGEKRTTSEPNSTKSGKMKFFKDDFDNTDRSRTIMNRPNESEVTIDSRRRVASESKSRHIAMLEEEKRIILNLPNESEVTIDSEEGESGTLVAILGNGFLVMGADSRAIGTAGETYALDRMKMYHIFDKVFALMTGNSRDSVAILKRVKKECAAVPPSSVKEIVNSIIKWANVLEHAVGVECGFIVGGKLPNSIMELFVVEKIESEGFVAFRSDIPCSLGRDKDYARIYIEQHKFEILRLRDDPVRTAYQVRDALAYAVLNGKHSGGDLKVMILEEDGTFVMYSSAREQKEEGGYKDLAVSAWRPLKWSIKEVRSNIPNAADYFDDIL